MLVSGFVPSHGHMERGCLGPAPPDKSNRESPRHEHRVPALEKPSEPSSDPRPSALELGSVAEQKPLIHWLTWLKTIQLNPLCCRERVLCAAEMEKERETKSSPCRGAAEPGRGQGLGGQ